MFNPLRNLSLDRDFLTRKWIWWLHSQASLFDWLQSTNILILCSEKWLIPPVLNELVDRHVFIFPIPVCNQPRRNFWNLLFFFRSFFGGDPEEMSDGIQMQQLKDFCHYLLVVQRWVGSIRYMICTIPCRALDGFNSSVTQTSTELSSLSMKKVMFLKFIWFRSFRSSLSFLKGFDLWDDDCRRVEFKILAAILSLGFLGFFFFSLNLAKFCETHSVQKVFCTFLVLSSHSWLVPCMWVCDSITFLDLQSASNFWVN